MAPLAAQASMQTIGANETAIQPNIILTFFAILFAGMQGTVCMESADPCRISYTKLLFLLGLETLQVIAVVVAEALSFVDLQRALSSRLTWLQWMPSCILVQGLTLLLFDIYYTLNAIAKCRIQWCPFSTTGFIKDKTNFIHSFFPELLLMVPTGSMSLVLIGWRQK